MKLTITRLGHQGDGIAPGPVYAPRVLPSEVVEGDVAGGRMASPKIITPSSDRVTPPCRHYKSCGGCALQHASDGFVASWKQDVVRQTLGAQGLEAELLPVQTSPPNSRRRAVFSGRRSKKGALVGFHAPASGVIVEVPDCHLLHPDLLAALPALRKLTVLCASRKGAVRFTLTQSGAGIDVMVTGAKPLDANLRMELAALANEYGFARLTFEEELIALRAAPCQVFAAARVTPPAGAFLQATAEGEKALVSALLDTIFGAKHVADLFAGCGTFALPVAKNAEVHAVEGDGEMLAALDQGWRGAKGLKQISTEVRDLFRRPLLPDELKRFDAVVIDPPRAGAEAQTVQLAKAQAPVIASISCNPASFSRDAKILTQAGYTLGPVHIIDQFRWSTHVEIAAALTLM